MDSVSASMTPQEYQFGPRVTEDGVSFRLWAPKARHVRLDLDGREIQMEPGPDGWFVAHVAGTRPGARYRFILPDGLRVPDPASRFQPEDVHGPSEVVSPHAHIWKTPNWRGRRWEEAVLYELHVGAFTQEGTFRAAARKLDTLVELGVTALQLMPVADFPGARNWGYDGVLLFAPDSAYGRPEDLKALVDEAHARGMMVIQDVVYNHFGPDGNYMPLYAPIFNDRIQTPWGGAVNFDGPDSGPVRRFVIENAIYWLDEFRMDGLRLDAVHAIKDSGDSHMLDEFVEAVRASQPDRQIHLILENEENEASRLTRDDEGTPRTFTAQWNDDVHHVLHTAVTGEASGYYSDYAGDVEKLGRALAQGFAFQGEVMSYRGHARGEPCGHLHPSAFVAFIQNHDQVGNRAFGDRLSAVQDRKTLMAAASIYLLLPQTPMIFMGEEWAAAQPFPFFCDFGLELAQAVRTGRRHEFSRFPEFQDPAALERIPDPTAEATFLSAKLDWPARERAPHSEVLALYRKLLEARRNEIVPRLWPGMTGGEYQQIGPRALAVRWGLQDGSRLALDLNLGEQAAACPQVGAGRLVFVFGNVSDRELGAWSVRWSIAE